MILDDIVESTKIRLQKDKEVHKLETIKAQALAMAKAELEEKGRFDYPFEQALQAQDFNFICEVKKASPSKGIIVEDFPYRSIAKDYERAGAAAISVLTEPDYFKGSPQYLKDIAEIVDIPIIRKDFTIDEFQIYEAKTLGASAILLICAILDMPTLTRFRKLADSLGLSVLVEAHDEKEVQMAIDCGARIIGVNNRNLKDFTVNVNNSIRLRHLAPRECIFVSESGLETPEDIQALRDNDIHAALMGETFMRSQDKIGMLARLYGPLRPLANRDYGREFSKKTTQVYSPLVKYCGISDLSSIRDLVDAQPDYMGLVFAPSRRHVSKEEAKALVTALRTAEGVRQSGVGGATYNQAFAKPSSKPIQVVGVFVNESIEQIVSIAQYVGLDVIQVHGDEDEAFVKDLKEKTNLPVWKAFPIKDREDVVKAQASSADMLLFDAYSKEGRGGLGKTFNWCLLDDCKKPFMLAGGLTEFNLARAIRTVRPLGIDLSSGLEINGRKDGILMASIMEIIEKVSHR